jgi:zinc/manganese transport system substrate-binding protein
MTLKSSILLFALAALSGAAPVYAKLKIVTTAPDYADMARQIGGDNVDVHSVMKGPENVHNVMAKPTEMVKLNDADLFVHSGLDAEPWRENLLRGARNPKVNVGQPGNVDMSVGIQLMEVPEGRVGRDQGDVHAFGSPHYTVHPQNVQRMAVTLLKAMMQADPANAERYKENAKKFVLDIARVQKELREKFKPYAGLRVVTFHAAWVYFADAFDIRIAGTIEPKPAITPSPAQVQEIIDLMKRQDVKVVICETYSDPKLAQYVADQAGAKMIVLPDHVNGVPEADTCQNFFRYNVEKLIEAARAAGIQPNPATEPAKAGGPNAR